MHAACLPFTQHFPREVVLTRFQSLAFSGCPRCSRNGQHAQPDARAGLFARANSVNTNNRLYPKRVLHREVQKFAAEQVKAQCALGELDHPSYSAPTFKHLNLANVSHQVLSLKWKGNAVWGWIEVRCFAAGAGLGRG